ncbi:sensor histidine kinase [Paenimyroides ceti]
MKLKRSTVVRFLLNSFFTGWILYTAIDNNDEKLPLVHIVMYNVLLFVPSWINNFLFFPLVRKNRNILQFLLSMAGVFITIIFIQGNYLNWLKQTFHTNDLNDFTPLAITYTSPEFLKNYQYCFDVFPGVLMITVLMAIGYVMQELILKIKKQKQIESQQILAELQLLKSQISPHFLFNVLNSLYALSLKTSRETPDVILKLSDILRYSLYEAQEKEVPVRDEIHIINTYIAIESLRISERADVSFVSEGINDTIRIAPMLLLPLIENAFKHGIDSTVGHSYIKASLHYKENALIFTCENNFKETAVKKIGGIGIDNIRKRLQLLYPAMHKIDLEKKDDVFTVTLKINL